MSRNYVFRELECGLTIEETANICFKSVRTVKDWDKGNPIPPECKRLMRLVSGRELSPGEDWEQFRMHKTKLELPTGQLVTPQEILTGIALIEIGTEQDRGAMKKLLKFARVLKKIM
ncbi:bacteriophage f237 ORF9 [Vibrio sp. AND4]|nr:bacteriophage f237 ORF9 [Vibrio sp. AND4]